MLQHRNERNFIHKAFEIGVILKGLNGVLEIIGGILLFAISPETINRTVILLTQNEIGTDPNDRIANLLLNAAHKLSLGGQLYGGIFLLSHGLIKLFLITALLKKRLWAYPTAIIVFALFIIYQLYRYGITRSPSLILLSIIDVFVIVLTYLEYKNLEASYHGVPR